MSCASAARDGSAVGGHRRLAANITMALVDVAPDGSRHLITRAWTDPQNRTDIRTTEAVVPPDLRPRIAVRADRVPHPGRARPRGDGGFQRHRHPLLPAPGTTLTVDTSQTFVDVPVAGGEQLVSTLVEDIAHPTLSVAAASVREGERRRSGAGFAPGVDLTVSMDADGVLPATVRTSARAPLGGLRSTGRSAGECTVVASAGRASGACRVHRGPRAHADAESERRFRGGCRLRCECRHGWHRGRADLRSGDGSPAGALAATGTDAAPAGPVTAALLLRAVGRCSSRCAGVDRTPGRDASIEKQRGPARAIAGRPLAFVIARYVRARPDRHFRESRRPSPFRYRNRRVGREPIADRGHYRVWMTTTPGCGPGAPRRRARARRAVRSVRRTAVPARVAPADPSRGREGRRDRGVLRAVAQTRLGASGRRVAPALAADDRRALRTQSRALEQEVPRPAGSGTGRGNRDGGARRERVLSALKRLPEREQAVVVLSVLEATPSARSLRHSAFRPER